MACNINKLANKIFKNLNNYQITNKKNIILKSVKINLKISNLKCKINQNKKI